MLNRLQSFLFYWFMIGCQPDSLFHRFEYKGELWWGCGSRFEREKHNCTRKCKICGLTQKIYYYPSVAGDGQPLHVWEKV